MRKEESKSALVLPAKSQSGFFEEIDQETGEIQRLTVKKRTKEFAVFLACFSLFATVI
jgi:hypothetical protein